jgi:hypothetical protein
MNCEKVIAVLNKELTKAEVIQFDDKKNKLN